MVSLGTLPYVGASGKGLIYHEASMIGSRESIICDGKVVS